MNSGLSFVLLMALSLICRLFGFTAVEHLLDVLILLVLFQIVVTNAVTNAVK